MAFLRIVGVEVTYVNISCSREVIWSFLTWKLIGFFPSSLRPFFPVTSVGSFIYSGLSLSCYFIVLFIISIFPIFIFFSPHLNRHIFFVLFLRLPCAFLIVSIFSILFSSALHFCFCLPIPPPSRFIYFRYSSANECIKIPANRERKLRITSVWTPSSYQASNGEPVDHKAGM